MTNLEKYAEEIKNYKGYEFCKDFVEVKVLNPLGLKCDIGCSRCDMLRTMWLMSEYTEPEVDWTKVVVDTPIVVRNFETGNWYKRYFAKFEDGKVYAWLDGRTSWNSNDETHGWKHAKLAEQEESDE